MAKITPNQRFLDGEDAYEEGTEYEVPDTKAYYFGMNGWLAESDVDGLPEGVLRPKSETPPEPVELNVDKATHTQKASDV